jgi:hypothetical protein
LPATRRAACLRVARAASITLGRARTRAGQREVAGTLAARHCRMARPHVRDLVTWSCTLPASVLLVVCLFLPQVDDCNGHVRSAFDTGAAPYMVALALIGILPILWRSRALRAPIFAVTGVATACLLIASVAGIPVLLVLAFVMVFPVVVLLGDWKIGGELTWAAAWLELFGTIWWAAAASDR